MHMARCIINAIITKVSMSTLHFNDIETKMQSPFACLMNNNNKSVTNLYNACDCVTISSNTQNDFAFL